MSRKKTSAGAPYIAKAAVIAAAYTALSYLSAAFGLAFGPVQFRLSEALCLLPLVFPEAVAGLTVGCLLSNIISSVSPFDMLIGTFATFIAALLTKKLSGVRIKNEPVLSYLSPVIVNALFVGAEIAFFTSRDTFAAAFAMNALSVGAGEAAVILIPGIIITKEISKKTVKK